MVSVLGTGNAVPSSSPAFATPLHPIRPHNPTPIQAPAFKAPNVLPIILPPPTLRPLAFRVFTKKHNLTVSTTALSSLATFVGRHCGSGWKDEGLAEGVLEETAKMWKKQSTDPIVNGESDILKSILKTLESYMSGGRVIAGRSILSRQSSSLDIAAVRPGLQSRESFGVSRLDISNDNDDEDEDSWKDPRDWLKVIDAFAQPRMVYNTSKKHFEKSKSKPCLFPPPSHKTDLFRQRYHLVHQRILRNESFQTSTFASRPSNSNEINKITPIANLLGRTNSPHLLLGLLTVLPSGLLALSDLTGSIPLDIQHAQAFPSHEAAWFCPGMILLVDGVYVEDGTGASETGLGSTGGIGGTIGGKFLASVIGHPPCERRYATLGIQESPDVLSTGPAFGWTDFLGLGSERATGPRMRKLESRILGPGSPHEGNSKIVIASEVNIDQPATLASIRTLFASYAARPANETPLAMVLMGNFVSQAALAGAPGGGSIEYKECFNGLAAVLSDFPALISRTSLVFVPGDLDAWASSFSAGSAIPVPRKAVPEVFTSRVRRVVAEANRETRGQRKGAKEGEVVWTSNPARLSWFGCAGEMVLFRDDVSGRMRRTAVRVGKPSSGQDHSAGDGVRDVNANAKDHESSQQHDEIMAMDGSDDTQPMDLDASDLAAADKTTTERPAGNEATTTDPDVAAARRLTKTLLDQAHLSPFPLHARPVHWDYGNVLHLYPLPTTLVLADSEAPAFALNYMGCCVLNPGKLVDGRKGERARWIEYDIMTNKGMVRTEDS